MIKKIKNMKRGADDEDAPARRLAAQWVYIDRLEQMRQNMNAQLNAINNQRLAWQFRPVQQPEDLMEGVSAEESVGSEEFDRVDDLLEAQQDILGQGIDNVDRVRQNIIDALPEEEESSEAASTEEPN